VILMCRVTDSDLANVAGFTHLEALELHGSNVTDSGILQLTNCSELRYLGIKRTKVTPDAVKKLQEALPDCKILY